MMIYHWICMTTAVISSLQLSLKLSDTIHKTITKLSDSNCNRFSIGIIPLTKSISHSIMHLHLNPKPETLHQLEFPAFCIVIKWTTCWLHGLPIINVSTYHNNYPCFSKHIVTSADVRIMVARDMRNQMELNMPCSILRVEEVGFVVLSTYSSLRKSPSILHSTHMTCLV
jgi:hypothetical protein